MRTRYFLVLLLLCSYGFGPTSVYGQQSSGDVNRKLIRKVDPNYPEMARRMNIAGTVKVYAVIAPDGTVKSVEPVGGSPLLVQAAEDAISRWKFAPAGAESKELVELHFHQ
jgi:TonB family protein